MKKWILRILGGILALILAIFVVAAALPVPTDPFILPEDSGAGSSTISPSFTGLQREFPSIIAPLDNPTTAAKIELGRLLFYDPILSMDNDLSCAHCHHPDAGFADGQVTALGAGGLGAGPERSGGVTLNRNTPSLWNVAYVPALFWDGRAATLEDQTNNPLTHVDEMGANPAEITAELQALDEYQQLFSQAFAGSGAEAVTFENTQRALASFQRSLVTNTSPFDRYAAGQIEALTAQQRRGLNLFRSEATGCFECHAAPTFASESFRVIGVPSDDPGRGAITDSVPDGSFRVPTLRNVALSAPYMHDGSLATLEAVVEFYADGGGRAFGNEEIDPLVRSFELTEQEKADLVAFLYALTDERQLPQVPRDVPSGLPTVQRLSSPGRDAATATNSVIGNGGQIDDRPVQTFIVLPGESIQAAVDQARSGDTVMIEYGIYHETVVVDLNNITLEGIPNDDGDRPVLDGQELLSAGIISSGSNFAVGQLHIRDYSDNGILVEGVTGVHIYDIFSENTGTYGLYPAQSTDVIIERTEVVGNHDAGIYAGQCENVVVRESVVYGNTIGIEIENTLTAEVYDNLAYDNTTGILVVLLPNLTSQVSRNTRLYNNVVQDNNVDNFGRAGNTVSLLPPGIGILILSSDNAEAYNNRVSGNKTSGIAIFNLESTGIFQKLAVDPTPEFNYLHDNIFENNGYEPDQFVKDLGISGGDILWDGTGFGNTFNEPGADGVFPPVLPGNGWPDAFQRVYHRALTFWLGLVAKQDG